MQRREFLKGLGLLLAAPAVVKAASLMPIKMPVIYRPKVSLVDGQGNTIWEERIKIIKDGEWHVYTHHMTAKKFETIYAWHIDCDAQLDPTFGAILASGGTVTGHPRIGDTVNRSMVAGDSLQLSYWLKSV